MLVRVIEKYRDRDTGSMLRPGLVIDVTEERFDELAAGGFVEKIESDSPEDDGSDFDEMTKAEIVEYAKGREIELSMEMTKAEMVEKLR